MIIRLVVVIPLFVRCCRRRGRSNSPRSRRVLLGRKRIERGRRQRRGCVDVYAFGLVLRELGEDGPTPAGRACGGDTERCVRCGLLSRTSRAASLDTAQWGDEGNWRVQDTTHGWKLPLGR